MARKIYLNVTVPVILTVNEGVSMEDAMDNLEIAVTANPKGPVSVEDVGPFNQWEVTDSK